MKARAATFALIILSLAVYAERVSAEQFVAAYQGRQVVVHTYRLPVIMHRLVPPQYGRHITIKELHAGTTTTPMPSRFNSARWALAPVHIQQAAEH